MKRIKYQYYLEMADIYRVLAENCSDENKRKRYSIKAFWYKVRMINALHEINPEVPTWQELYMNGAMNAKL